MKSGKQNSAIPRKPLLWLALAMLFIVPPMYGNLLSWVPSVFLGSLIAKFLMEWRGTRLRSIYLKAAGIVAGLGCVAFSYQTLLGAEPTLSLCLVLFSVKILEAHTARDFHILAALGWFLCLAELMISQDLAPALYALSAFVLVLVAVFQFHRGRTPEKSVFTSLRAGIGLVLQALPLVVALFFFFPRVSGGFRFVQNHASSNRTGMSDSLAPGSIASLALSNEVAFRVEFPDGNMPSASDLYWRGGIFSKGNGLNWKPAKSDVLWHKPESLSGVPVRQRVILQPNNGRWIFALDRPAKAPAGTRLMTGSVLLADQTVYSTFLYEVTSRPNSRDLELPLREQKTCLQLPETISPQVRALVQSWTNNSSDPRSVVAAALRYFHDEKFSYSLSPGEYGADALDEFLFQRRAGFCEHYAAAMATLMRVAGIPSRVVVGYQGGEFNTIGNYLLVRQSDAHAWCEIWLPKKGWERLDPTLAVAPERIKMGFASFMELRGKSGAGGVAGGDGQFALAQRGFLHRLQLAWDTLNYEWNTQVSGFDEDSQRSFFQTIGLLNPRSAILFGWIVLIGILLLGGQLVLSWWNSRARPDPSLILYQRFCRRARALGVERNPSEGPRHFSERAARLLPDHAAQIRRIAGCYIDLRYSREPSETAIGALSREIKAFCRGRWPI